ncbi:MAG: tRNA uridine-5-carboxymethylaminomethyl(34) synthesis GTPase MnmE [Candidatus Omnitrophota bacterium]|nr:tRNA uridine-5-carboxymethylaminomethyl(34) synthesis GTPase MnmE [Candidatus Omnitrophota bacterium]
MHKNTIDDTIVAPATPIGEGGIGIVRISGGKALEIADKIFVPKNGKKPSEGEFYTIHYGHIIHRRGVVVENHMTPPRCTANDEIVDEVLLTVMRAPKSYTKEDVIEINCHGGIQAVKNVLDLAVKLGARLAEPGEFTKRAFLNGRIDLIQAEAVLDVIRAKTEGSLKAALGQLDGKLSKDLSIILDGLVDIASHIEAAIDFPDEQLDIIKEEGLAGKVKELTGRVKGLVESFGEGVVLREGVLAVICGKPNVGKSSLMNLLLKRDRCLVAPIPGTTRDAVEEMINIKGVPIRLADTAGIGAVKDALYEASAGKSRSYIERSDIVLLMLDASSQISEEDISIIRLTESRKKIVIINKTDIGKKINKKSIAGLFKNDVIIEMSVEKNKNIELLEGAILDSIYSGKFTQGESSLVTNARHKELLDKALENMTSADRLIKEGSHPELIAVDLKEAIFNIGLIAGKSVSDDILDRIFENFCIGK